MSKAFAMIMAGGASESLSVLTETRAEPALPFAGKYRIIDFPLSNCVNSDIYNVAVLTQYRPRSLNAHIGTGKPWDLDLATGGVHLLQPFRGGPFGDWQKGTADAVRRNLEFIQQQAEEHVLILAGDHIYLMDYRPMIRQHAQSGADVTVAVRRVSPHETHRFGIVSVGADNRIVGFQEKPRRTRETLASMGIYVFRKDALMRVLTEGDGIDFARDVLPAMLEADRSMVAYQFFGYWEDVGTVQSYWEANMSLLAEDPALDLYDQAWVVHTRSVEKAPVRMGPHAVIDGNLISNGCIVNGVVERSILSPGVLVAEGAVVKDSIVLNDTRIEAGAVVDRCIIDKGSVIGAGAMVGCGDDNTPCREMPERLNTGITLIGRSAVVPEKMVLGRNVAVHPFVDADAYGRKKKIASGLSVGQVRR
jgi:glucose-1-phosphate adenylyltransferase